jgi:hypothetical protein
MLLLLALCVGNGRQATAAVLLSDEFPGSVINSDAWETITLNTGSSVSVADGIALLTDRGRLSPKGEFETVEIRGRAKFTQSPSDVLKIILRTDGSLFNDQYLESANGIRVGITSSSNWDSDASRNVTVDEPGRAQSVGGLQLPMGVFFDFRIVDSGGQIKVYVGDLSNPLVTWSSQSRWGNRITFYNRERIGGIHHGTAFDYIEVSSISPRIVQQPKPVEVPLGGSAEFEVNAEGVGQLRYQWRFNGARIIGATNATLPIAGISALDEGEYTVQVTDDDGSVVSEPARLNLLKDTDGDGLSDNYERGAGRYEIVTGNFSWQEAKADAKGKGGHLATITSPEEWSYLAGQFGNSLLRLYLGASDQASEGVWEWVTGEPFRYTRWGSGQPDNAGGLQHYLWLHPDGSGWDDFASVPGGDAAVMGYLLERGFFTDPNNPDSDGDGFNDGVEVSAGSIPTDETSKPLPKFIALPANQTVTNGAAVTFSVGASGFGPISFQWQHNGVELTTETNSTLTLPEISREDAGAYTVTASNPAGSVTSPAAHLVVTPLTELELLAGDFVLVRIHDIRSGPWRVERSEDLLTWESIGTATFSNGVSALLETASQGVGRKFYRAVSP